MKNTMLFAWVDISVDRFFTHGYTPIQVHGKKRFEDKDETFITLN